METLFLPLSLVAGALLAVQAGANAQLSKATGSPFAATVLQLGVGSAALLVVTLATGQAGAFALLPGVRWWHAIGGIASALYVVSAILLFPRLGAVVSVGLFIAGQMLASLGLDLSGWLAVAARPLTISTVIGTAAVLAGATLIVFGQKAATTTAGGSKAGWMLLALLAGAVLPVQGAVNGLLRADLQAPFAVGTISFVVAMSAMALLLAVATGTGTRPRWSGAPWWGWLGGFAGAIYVTTVFTAIPAIGAAATVALTVVGQQVASLFVDRYGWFRLPQRAVSPPRLAGVALLIAGVALLKFL